MRRGVEQSGSSLGSRDTKLKADIAESAVVTRLLKLGYRVLRPIGDRLPYDLVLDLGQRFCKIQVKSAWFRNGFYTVDSRQTKTNRRQMVRSRYQKEDFDFAILYIDDSDICYVMPFDIFSVYRSGISLVERSTRQRNARSAVYREAWDLLKKWAALPVTEEVRLPVKFGEAFKAVSNRMLDGNAEPSPPSSLAERCRD